MPGLNDNELAQEALWLRQFAAGDAIAGRRIIDRYLDRTHAMVARMLQGDVTEAEDICQESFLRLWKQAPRWQPEARIGTWLATVALNLARDRLRTRRPAVDAEAVDALVDGQANPEQQASQAQSQIALRGALAALPERQREAIVLRHIEQFSQAEAAGIMGVSEGALESLLVRARAALRAHLNGWNVEETRHATR